MSEPKNVPRRGPGHGPGHGPMMVGEKAKNFKGSSKKLLSYLRPFWLPMIFVMLFAAASTVFSIVGPKVLALATDELASGLMEMITGAQGGINFDYIGTVLLCLGGIYLLSAGFSYAQGYIMAGVTADVSYGLRDSIEKKLNRLPLSYFNRVSQGDVLSRITNDVDTLTNSLNQSVTQLITSVCTLIGVLIMMLSISWQLTLVALCIIPVSLAFVMVIVRFSQKHFMDLERMAHEETDAQVLNSIDSESTNPIPVIYQSGYLTIKGYDGEFGIYRLGFPNREVEEGFIRFLLPFYANVNKTESPFEIQKFVHEVRSGDYDSFFRRLQSFFADTTYEVIRDQELHYENVLFIVFKLVGFYTNVEYHTNNGRIDLVLQTDKFIYIMEFKLNGTAEEALQQINDKCYALPFEADGRKLFKIGINFSEKTRNIEKWVVES